MSNFKTCAREPNGNDEKAHASWIGPPYGRGGAQPLELQLDLELERKLKLIAYRLSSLEMEPLEMELDLKRKLKLQPLERKLELNRKLKLQLDLELVLADTVAAAPGAYRLSTIEHLRLNRKLKLQQELELELSRWEMERLESRAEVTLIEKLEQYKED